MIRSGGSERRDGRRYRRRLPWVATALMGWALFWVGSASAAAPTIEGESVSGVSPTNATLEAEIDPNGASAGAFYQFQLLPDPGEAPTELACPSSPPSGYSVCAGAQDSGALPLGWMSGGEAQTVTLELASAGVTLSPGRKYFFRVLVADRVFSEDVAEWDSPAVVGASEEFITPSLPSVESESASNVTPVGATLEAEVNLHGAAAGAYYQFQLALDPSEFATEILCPPMIQSVFMGCIGAQDSGALPIGYLAGNTLQPSATSHASLDLATAGLTLQRGTVYHYRVLVARRVATEDTLEWEPPTVIGGDRTFRTLSPDELTAPHHDQEEGTHPPAVPPVLVHHHHHRHHRHGRRHHHRLGGSGRAH